MAEDKRKVEQAKKIASKSSNEVRTIYESIEETVFKFFRWISSIIDRLFYSKKYTGLFALLLACLSYFVVTYDNSSAAALSSSKTLSNVSISARYNSESFELLGAPSSCEIVLSGEAANVTNAATKKGYCSINLEGYTEGTHTVKMTASGYGDSVSAVVNPSEVSVTLKKKTTMQFDLSYDYINQNALDSKYILSQPTFLSGSKINIRASQDTLNSISLVKALIDVSGQTADFEIEAPLVAYDKNGKVVDAEIVPSTVTAQVKVSSPHKSVDIKLRPTGKAPEGLAVDSVSMDHQTTEIYASEAILATINEVYVDFDLSTITNEAEIILPVSLPANVSSSDVTMVNVKVELAEVTTKTIKDVSLQYKNNNNNLAVSAIDVDKVDVIVTGSQANLDAFDDESVSVYFDCEGIEPGTYELPLVIECDSNPYVSFALSKNVVNITFVEAGE